MGLNFRPIDTSGIEVTQEEIEAFIAETRSFDRNGNEVPISQEEARRMVAMYRVWDEEEAKRPIPWTEVHTVDDFMIYCGHPELVGKELVECDDELFFGKGK